MKPGKVTKAALGILAAGMGAKKRMDKKKMVPGAIGGIGASMARLDAMKKILGMKMGGKIMKARKGTIIKPKGPGVLRMKPQDRYGQPMKPKPIKPKKKMGGGMMKKPMGYDKGGPSNKKMMQDALDDAKKRSGKSTFIQRRITLGGVGSEAAKAAKATRMGKIAAGVAAAALAAKAGLEKLYEKRTGKKPFTKRPDKKMGGGMMMRPNPVGYSKGVMVKTKLGRNKPTKMY